MGNETQGLCTKRGNITAVCGKPDTFHHALNECSGPYWTLARADLECVIEQWVKMVEMQRAQLPEEGRPEKLENARKTWWPHGQHQRVQRTLGVPAPGVPTEAEPEKQDRKNMAKCRWHQQLRYEWSTYLHHIADWAIRNGISAPYTETKAQHLARR